MTRVIATLDKSRRIGNRIVYARFVAQRLAADPTFSSPTLPLVVFEADIAAAEAAHAVASTRALGAASARNAALDKVRRDLLQLRSYVQMLADRSPGLAAVIVEAAGMNVKNVAGPSKPLFEVKEGPVSGSVHLVVKAPKTRSSYDWQYGLDGVTYVQADSTTRADKCLFDLTPLTRHYFRYRTLTKDGVSDWSDVICVSRDVAPGRARAALREVGRRGTSCRARLREVRRRGSIRLRVAKRRRRSRRRTRPPGRFGRGPRLWDSARGHGGNRSSRRRPRDG